MKVRSLLVAFLLLASTAQAGEQTTTDRVVEQAQDLFERTISIISSPFPFLSEREVQCLARNIFYKSASEPVEGKVAVGLVKYHQTESREYGKEGPRSVILNSPSINVPIPGSGEEPTMVRGEVNES